MSSMSHAKLRHSESLHHVLVLSIVADVVYVFIFLKKDSGYRRYTRFELRQDIDANTMCEFISDSIRMGS